MTDNEPKRGRGRPLKLVGAKRANFSTRIGQDVRERLAIAAQASGRSLSEEIEFRLARDLNWEATRDDIQQIRAEAVAIRSAAYVQAIRAAGMQILREIEGRPTRVIIDQQTLLAEAEGIAGGLRSGFLPETPRQITAEEERRLMQELRETRRKADEAVARTLAADKAAEADDSGEAA